MSSANETTSILWDISNKYQKIHGSLSLLVCVFGLISHSINMIVLTRKNMIRRETNIILLAISISDFLVLTTTTPYLIHFYIIHRDKSIFIPDPERDTKLWTIFLKTHIMSSVTFHTISVWLTVYLSCFRFFYLSSLMPRVHSFIQQTNQTWLRAKLNRLKSSIQNSFLKHNRMVMSIISAYVFGLLFCLPVFFYSTVKGSVYYSTNLNNESEPIAYYYLEQSDMNFITNDFIFKFMLYGQVVFTKLIPCSLIFVFTSLIIYKLVDKSRIENKLFNDNCAAKSALLNKNKSFVGVIKKANELLDSDKRERSQSEPYKLALDCVSHQLDAKVSAGSTSAPKKRKLNRKNLHFRTTIMLIVVCSLFLLVEFPITVLTLLSISMSDRFYYDVQVPLVEIMDLIVLIYPSINLILYCSMGSLFRRNLCKMFSKSCFKKAFVCEIRFNN